MKVVFEKYHLGFAHSVGDTAELPDDVAKVLIESGYVKELAKGKVQEAKAPKE